MTTVQLLIVCVTVLAVVAIVAYAAERRLTAHDPPELAGEIVEAIAAKQNRLLQEQLACSELIAAHTGELVEASLRASLESKSRARDLAFDYPEGALVVVHKKDGQSLKGKVVICGATAILLEDVYVIANGQETSVGGKWTIVSDDIGVVQEL